MQICDQDEALRRIAGVTMMASKKRGKSSKRDITLAHLRKRVLGGAYVLLDSLTEDELEAMQSMLFNDEAEIVNSACKPFLVAKLDKIIIPP